MPCAWQVAEVMRRLHLDPDIGELSCCSFNVLLLWLLPPPVLITWPADLLTFSFHRSCSLASFRCFMQHWR